jgi:hypothetical protein
MLESLDNPEVLLANGNWMKGKDDQRNFPYLLDSPDLQQIIEDHKELNKLELQFGEMILHVIEQIEKESEPLPSEKDLWPEISLLDMKRYLKTDVGVTGVSENSPVFVLDSVYSKLGQVLHNFNIYELCQLAACTKSELNHLIKQAPRIKPSDFEFAVQDAQSVMKIIQSEKDHKIKEPSANAWNSWGNLSQVSNMFQIKENTQKIASFMENLTPKHLTASFMDAFGGQPRDDEDIDSFETI